MYPKTPKNGCFPTYNLWMLTISVMIIHLGCRLVEIMTMTWTTCVSKGIALSLYLEK